MLPAELIERKRDGDRLSADELRRFLEAYMADEVEDYQMSAFLMAVYFRGLTASELSCMTRAMVQSGRRLDFRAEARPGGPGPAVDKHSTGGVGDKVSLVLAPLLAAAGLRVPMMSGRGLGHTGGTLDKLESIPGFRTDLDLREFRRVLDEVGCAMIGQTDEIAPLDGRLYGLRDVTGTVPSIPLIASSIVSKKLAEGVQALVLDVKCGSGAFLPAEADALELGRTLVDLAEGEGLPTRALVTGMEAPLGRAVGNALEVREAVSCLRGEGPQDVREVTLALSAELLLLSGAEEDPASAGARLETALDEGRAAERFRRLVEAQGGDPGIVDEPDQLPSAPVRRDLEADRDGWLASLDARTVGWTAVALGAGRERMGQAIDPAVGFEMLRRPGERVDEGDPLVRIHAASEESALAAAERLEEAVTLADAKPDGGAVAWEGRRVRYRITGDGVVDLRKEPGEPRS